MDDLWKYVAVCAKKNKTIFLPIEPLYYFKNILWSFKSSVC